MMELWQNVCSYVFNIEPFTFVKLALLYALDLWKMSPISPISNFYISQSNKGEVTFQKAIREMSEKNFGNIVYISALMMMI